MNRAQKWLVTKIILATLALVVSLIFYEKMSEALGNHKTIVMLFGLVALFIGAFGKSARVPTHTERHVEFSRVLDENPWIKTFYVIYGMITAIGGYYVISRQIEIGAFVFFGMLLLVMTPVIIFKLKQAYEEAGRSE